MPVPNRPLRAAWPVAALCWLFAVAPHAVLAADGPANVNAERLLGAGKDPANWPTVAGTYAENRYSALDQINAGNVAGLKLAWYGDFDTQRGQEGTPLAIDGVLYASSSWSKVYAYDAATGKQLWVFDPKVPGKTGPDACCDAVNRGVAAWEGKIYVGTLDGRLIAIHAKTGQQVWSTVTVDQTKPYTISGAPRIVKGKVLIGNAGGEYGVRGYISAYDAATGKLDWRFYTAPNPENKPDGAISDKVLMDKAYATWGNGSWKQSGGGAPVWDTIVYDADYDQILVGTGSGVPWSRRARSGDKGDNLFVASVLALDANTGAYKWHYQETPGEEWDFDSTMTMSLADLKLGGMERKVVLHAPKNGFFYVIDRKDGKLVSARNFTSVNWASGIDLKTGRPIEFAEARYGQKDGQPSTNGNDKNGYIGRPGAFGSHNWQPMAFSPKTGLAYIPAQEIPQQYLDDPNFVFKPGHGNWNLANLSTTALANGPTSETQRRVLKSMTRGMLIAWDPVQQKEAWRVQHPSAGPGGVFVTAGNLVFQGTPDGYFHAYAADSGKELWKYDGQVGIIAGAMSYQVGKDQYIAVLAGLGGINGMQLPYLESPRPGYGRVLVFKLDGAAKLPASTFALSPPQLPADAFTAAQVTRGEALFANCAMCHGPAAMSNGVIPDLRRSPMILNKDTFAAVVSKGVLEQMGMVSFANKLSPDDVEAVRGYIAGRAKQLHDDEATEAAGRAAAAATPN